MSEGGVEERTVILTDKEGCGRLDWYPALSDQTIELG
jgi:hypothetical protein